MDHQPATRDVKVTGRRVLATIVDSIILGVVSGVLSLSSGTHATSGARLTTLSSGGSALLLVIVLLYYVLLESLLGRTIGKMVTGIKVVDQRTGQRPGMLSAVLRTVLRIVDSFFAYGLGFVIVLCSGSRRRLGDMAARTVVVRARPAG